MRPMLKGESFRKMYSNLGLSFRERLPLSSEGQKRVGTCDIGKYSPGTNEKTGTFRTH